MLVEPARIAIEYDSEGGSAGYHAGDRAEADARKDELLRAVRWQVLRVRVRPLPPTSPADVVIERLAVAAGEVATAVRRLAAG